jgi:hypothetical protein
MTVETMVALFLNSSLNFSHHLPANVYFIKPTNTAYGIEARASAPICGNAFL